MIRSRAAQFGIPQKKINSTELHVHLPDGVGKDGPSAGLAIATAMISELTGIKVNRKVAMTGAIDVKGNAWEIGGLREKLEGARKAGADIVIIPKGNAKDLAKIPDSIKAGLQIIPVSRIEEVLKIALVEKLTPITEDLERSSDDTMAYELLNTFVRMARSITPANDVTPKDQKPPEKKSALGAEPK